MVLVAGHGSGAVVQHNYCGVALIVDNIQEPRDPGMKEGGVSNHAHHLSLLPCFLHAVSHGDSRSHAEDAVHPVQGRKSAQAVASDVPGDHHILPGEGIKDPSVRATGAEHRRAGRKELSIWILFLSGGLSSIHQPSGLEQSVYGQLHDPRHEISPLAGYPQGFYVLFYEWIQFLNHQQPVHTLGKLPDQCVREGIRESQLQNRGLRPDLAGILVGDGGGDDSQAF
ncbi:MAG: hypothetical protein A4E48_02109 [Methanosaeta sp. PtaU1.Bin060]|nr:MAG: hypothetical protein A4E48_02109 [Methanosaeta sp. PtaU1.Bin060]